MARIDRNTILIPYGAARCGAEQLSVTGTGGDIALACTLPHVVIDSAAREPLRLNSAVWEFARPPPLAEMPEVAAQLAFLRDRLKRHCGVWDKPPKLFLDRYFDFVQGRIAAERAALAAALARFGTLYRIDHWAFSALMPLPRAHLFAPSPTPTPNDAAAPYDPASLIAVDFALWTGTDIVAIDLGPVAAGAARRNRRLERAGVVRIEIPPTLLAPKDGGEGGREAAFAALMPDAVRDFWRGETLPSGPFKAAGLR